MTPSQASILWLSPTYGYGGDIMYYRAIFAGFLAAFPKTRFLADVNFPAERYAELPFWPALRSSTVTARRQAHGAQYDWPRYMPSIGSVWRIFSSRARLFVLQEFTPVALVGFVAAKLFGARTLLLVENDPAFRGSGGVNRNRIKSFVAKRANAVLTSNALSARYLLEDLGVDEERIIVGPYHTSDPGLGQAAGESGSLVRDPSRLNLLFLNGLTIRKGILELVRGIGRMKPADRARVLVHVVGDGDVRVAADGLVRELGLLDSFRFYGAVPYENTGEYYKAADLFVSTTLADYRSFTGFEALNSGLPIIASKHDGASHEVVEEQRNGWIVDPSDADDVARAITAALADPGRLRSFAAESKSMSKRFSVEQIVANLVGAARRALGEQ